MFLPPSVPARLLILALLSACLGASGEASVPALPDAPVAAFEAAYEVGFRSTLRFYEGPGKEPAISHDADITILVTDSRVRYDAHIDAMEEGFQRWHLTNLLDLDTALTTTIDHRARTYQVWKQPAECEVDERLSPDGKLVEVVATGDRERIGGYEAREYRAEVSRLLTYRKIGSYWYAERHDDAGVNEVVGIAMRLLDCSLSGGGFADLSALRGFPVRVVTRDYRRGGVLESQLELTHLETRDVDPLEFVLPEGYRHIHGDPWSFFPD